MKRWWPLFAAIVYVGATFASVIGLPKAPGVNASGNVLVRYYRDHADALRTATWLLTWALVPFVILMAHVRSLLCGLCRDVMLISVTMFLATGTVWTWAAACAAGPGAVVVRSEGVRGTTPGTGRRRSTAAGVAAEPSTGLTPLSPAAATVRA